MSDREFQGFVLNIPETMFSFFNKKVNNRLKEVINYLLQINIDFINFEILVESAPIDWRQYSLKMGINNQTAFPSTNFPLIPEVFNKSNNKGRHVTVKFRSPAEKALFDHFYNSSCLFFPCPLGISKGFNDPYYKEPDYLVCHNGKWGILEVVKDTTHSSVENEAKRTRQFQNHNVSMLQFTYQECLSTPKR